MSLLLLVSEILSVRLLTTRICENVDYLTDKWKESLLIWYIYLCEMLVAYMCDNENETVHK